MQAVQTSSLPTLPTALSLWRSGGFPSGVSRLFNRQPASWKRPLYLFSISTIPLQLNKHCTVAHSETAFRQSEDEDGPSEILFKAVHYFRTVFTHHRSQLGLRKYYFDEVESCFTANISIFCKGREQHVFCCLRGQWILDFQLFCINPKL